MREILRKLGFSEKEIDVYLAAFQLGNGSISALSMQAKIKRPTTYVILDKLSKNNLISLENKGNKQFFSVQSPKKLFELIEKKKRILAEKEKLVKQSLPLLKSISNKDVSMPEIRYFEGKEGVWNIIEDLISSKSEAWIIVPGKIYDTFGIDRMMANVIQKRREMQKKAYIIMDHHPENIKLWQLQENNVRECRFVSKEIDLSTTVYIYFNRVSLIFWKEPFSGLIIENERFFKMMRFMFDSLWKELEGENLPDGKIIKSAITENSESDAKTDPESSPE